MSPTLIAFVFYVNIAIIWFFLFINLCYIILLLTSIPDILARFKETLIGNINYFIESSSMPPVTAILSAYNERKGYR